MKGRALNHDLSGFRKPRSLTEDLSRIPGQIVKTDGSWKQRAIVATMGNQSLLGAILIATLGMAPDNPPRVVSAAEVDEEGNVLAFFQKRGEEGATLTRLCSLDELVTNFRGLADALALSDPDRQAMFKELRSWVVKDHRAEQPFLGLEEKVV